MVDQKPTYSWITQAKARGYGDTIRLILDVIEPIGPLAAQALWICQPAARLFGANDMVGELAKVLEEPNGVDSLRQQLED